MLQQQGGTARPTNRVSYSDGGEDVKMSRHEREEFNTAVIREARRRIAEKYGETEE